MAEYEGTIELISGITPKNGGSFPLVNAKDVMMPDGSRLSEFEGGGGGQPVLVVEIDENGVPSAYAPEIYEWYQDGGVAVLRFADGSIASIQEIYSDWLSFFTVADDLSFEYGEIGTSGSVLWNEGYLATHEDIQNNNPVLIVEIDENDVPSANASEIFDWYQDGGIAVLRMGDSFCPFTCVESRNAQAVMILEDGSTFGYEISADGSVATYSDILGSYITRAEFDETVGDIETALDSIIAIQEELIGGESA